MVLTTCVSVPASLSQMAHAPWSNVHTTGSNTSSCGVSTRFHSSLRFKYSIIGYATGSRKIVVCATRSLLYPVSLSAPSEPVYQPHTVSLLRLPYGDYLPFAPRHSLGRSGSR